VNILVHYTFATLG